MSSASFFSWELMDNPTGILSNFMYLTIRLVTFGQGPFSSYPLTRDPSGQSFQDFDIGFTSLKDTARLEVGWPERSRILSHRQETYFMKLTRGPNLIHRTHVIQIINQVAPTGPGFWWRLSVC